MMRLVAKQKFVSMVNAKRDVSMTIIVNMVKNATKILAIHLVRREMTAIHLIIAILITKSAYLDAQLGRVSCFLPYIFT